MLPQGGSRRGGTRTYAENAGETALLQEGDAKSDVFDRGSWGELRDAIAVCPDLPKDVRQSLIDMGDDVGRGSLFELES